MEPKMGKPPAVRATEMVLDGRAWIDGQRVDALSGASFDKHSPIDGRLLTRVARGAAADIDRAVRAGRRSFDAGDWRRRSPADRKAVLLRLADTLQAHADDLALLETLDVGKPIQFARSVDVNSTIRCFRWYAEAIDKRYDEIAPTPENALGLITREPLGVAGVIVPWNYPLIMAAWKVAPALASGCSVVLKPSERSPLTALRLAELAHEAGLPPGVFNVVPGFGAEAGEPLALHPDVDVIAFTGSTRIGKRIHILAGESNLKRAWTELGGKSPNIVFADCPDPDRAARAAVDSVFFNQGQTCNAPTRLYIEASFHDAFIERMREHARRWVPADPLDPTAIMGSLVDEAHLRTVQRYIASGVADGARLLMGGQQVRAESGGWYLEPAIFDRARADMTIVREEIFGPVLSVLPFTDAAAVVAEANRSPYGLQAAVWTADLNRAHGVARALRAGTVHVNQYDEDDITVPFGGFRQSGIGRDKSLHAFDKYTELKTTWIRIDSPVS